MPIRMSGLASGLDTDSIVKQLMSAQRLKSTKIEKNITKLEWKQDKWKTLNSKIYSLYTGSLSKIKMQGNFNTKKATSSNSAKVEVNADSSVPEGTHSIKVNSVANAQFITGDKLSNMNVNSSTKLTGTGGLGMDASIGSSVTITVGGVDSYFNITSTSTVGDFIDSLNKAGLNAAFDTTQQRFFISSKESGIKNAFSIKSSDPANPVDLTKLGLSDIIANTTNGTVDVTVGNGVSRVNPSDAIIIYNGAEIRSSSNSISVNGLNVVVKGTTDSIANGAATDEVISVTISKDTQAIYDMIKGFVKSYNEVLQEMNTAFDAESAKGYEPLTAEEKDAMTDDQIEKWEDKIKNSLLRRDGTLGTLISTMRTNLNQSVSVNGKSYSLSSFGITSISYTEEGLLHINGDKDDILASSKEDALMKAISDNPDAVTEVFTKLTGKLYGELTDRMKSTSLNSALTLYNDKEMNKTLDDYKEDLSNLEDRLQKMEDRYYKQFTAMEKMITQSNAKSSSLSSLLGSNTGS